MFEILYCFFCKSHTLTVKVDAPKETITTCGNCHKKSRVGTIRSAMKHFGISPRKAEGKTDG